MSTSIFLSSNPSAGASNVSADFSTFTVNFNQPIEMRGKKARVAVQSAEIPYSWINISATLQNNTLQVSNSFGTYDFIFTDGIYGLNDINQGLSDAILDTPALNITNAALVPFFTGVNATSLVWLEMPATGSNLTAFTIHMGSSSMASILGFGGTGNYVGSGSQNQYFLSPHTSSLNALITNAYISISFAKGSQLGQQSNNSVCANISPGNYGVGQTIEYIPQNLLFSDVAADTINSVTVKLQRIDGTNMALSDYYSIVLLLTY